MEGQLTISIRGVGLRGALAFPFYINENICIFNKHTIMVALDSVLGP